MSKNSENGGTQVDRALARIGRLWPNRAFALGGVLVLALGLRIFAASTQRNIVWPDEIYQTAEPARHLVYGDWIPSWEWVVGMRSWLPPALLAPPLEIGRLIDPSGRLDTHTISAFMVLLSLTPVAIACRWGERVEGIRGGLFVGGAAAVWVDLIYMAPHPLIDVFASHSFILALYLLFPLTERPSGRRLAAAAIVLTLTVYLRQQLAPAAAIACVLAVRTDWRSWRTLGSAAVGALASLALLDWATLGTPLQSVWLNTWFNIIGGVSGEYGVDAPLYFVTLLDRHWGLITVSAAAALILVRSRKYGKLAVTSGVIILTMSLVPHKEWRFIFPFLTVFPVLLALKVLDAGHTVERRLGAGGPSANIVLLLAFIGIAIVSAAIATGEGYVQDWQRNRAMLLSFDRLRSSKGICGVGILYLQGNAAPDSWVYSPGSAALPPGVPLYAADTADNWRSATGYNALVVSDGQRPPAPFRSVQCFGKGTGNPLLPTAETCLWERSGGCDRAAIAPPRINWPAYFLDARGSLRPERLSPFRSKIGLPPALHVTPAPRARTP